MYSVSLVMRKPIVSLGSTCDSVAMCLMSMSVGVDAERRPSVHSAAFVSHRPPIPPMFEREREADANEMAVKLSGGTHSRG